jgi:hypothetical protein
MEVQLMDLLATLAKRLVYARLGAQVGLDPPVPVTVNAGSADHLVAVLGRQP